MITIRYLEDYELVLTERDKQAMNMGREIGMELLFRELPPWKELSPEVKAIAAALGHSAMSTDQRLITAINQAVDIKNKFTVGALVNSFSILLAQEIMKGKELR